MDSICNQAIITICRIDIRNPPAEIVFGKWNDRALNQLQAKQLALDIKKNDFRPFTSKNLLPLIVPRAALDPECIHPQLDASNAPFINLTPDAIRTGVQLTFAGGRHRHEASRIIQAEVKETIEALQDNIEELERKIGVAEEKKKSTAKMEKTLEAYNKELEGQEEWQKKAGIWGVIIYDEGE